VRNRNFKVRNRQHRSPLARIPRETSIRPWLPGSPPHAISELARSRINFDRESTVHCAQESRSEPARSLQANPASDAALLLTVLDVPRGALADVAARRGLDRPRAGAVRKPAFSGSYRFRGSNTSGYQLCKPWRDSTIMLSQRRAGVRRAAPRRESLSASLRRNASILAVVAAVLLVGAIALLTWFQFTSTHQARLWVRHSDQVITTADELGFAVRDAETGQRGYLLTGRADYLAAYRDALGRISVLQDELRRLTGDNPSQQARLRDIGPLLQRKLDELAQTVALRRDAGPDAALAVVRTDLGLHVMEQVEGLLRRMRDAEEHLLEARRQDLDHAESVTRWLAVGASTLAVVLLAVAGQLLARTRAQLVDAEADQHALMAQMRTAFDSISQGIAAFGADSRLARWNERFAVLLGLPGAMMRPGTAYEALVEQLATGDVAFLETEGQIRHGRGGRAPGEPVVYERTRPADGRSFELRRTALPEGGFVLTVTDTTERVRAEQTARDSQRLQAMGQLTGGIAHDFNNLLTVVLLNLEFAQNKSEPEAAALTYVDRAIWAARRGAALNHQLLAFARKQPLTPMPIILSDTLPDMANLLRRTLGEHIEVQVVDAAGLWPAMADPAQVESALLNLALNARDAMPNGGRLTIEVVNKVLDYDYARQHAEVTQGDYVMLAVSDSGNGMPAEVLARAFEPFFTTKGPGMGTGLGLAMVFGFAKQSSGHVKIYSEPGEGTTVRLYLPRAIGFQSAGSSRDEAPVELPHGAATVLVVEDDTAVREVAVEMLRDLGYRVLAAADGAEALRVFGENDAKVDLLLTDVVLTGGLKGNEVSRRLTEVRPGLRTLFMSGYTENAIVHHGRLDDGVQLIGKPFQRQQLARKVAEMLGTPRFAGSPGGDSKVVDLAARDRGRGG
jgi:signal transduction histidine kinase